MDFGAAVGMFGLVFGRIGGLFAMAPLFGSGWIPMPVRVALGLLLSGLLLPAAMAAGTVPEGDLAYLSALAREMAVGLASGFIAHLVFVAVQVAGQFLDLEMGFTLVEVADPTVAGQNLPVTGNLLYMLALMLFLGGNGHLLLLRGLAAGLERNPPGAFGLGEGSYRLIVDEFAGMFLSAVAVALPVLGVLFLSTVLLGIVSRAVPQINVFMTGIPVKIAIGVGVLFLIAPVFVQQLQEHLAHAGEALAALLATLEGR